MHMQFGPGHKDKHLAAALKVDRSTVNRLRHGTHPPTQERLEALSRFLDVPSQAWHEPPQQFADAFGRRRQAHTANASLPGRSVEMVSITAHRHLWASSFDIHRGQYVAWWRALGIDDCYAGSLVEIPSLDHHGMRFSMLNPYIQDDADFGEVRCWRYEGLAFPVADYLYFYGEQEGGTYELLTMILTASPLSPPDLLRGCLSGIYVKDGRKQIAVNVAVVLMYLQTAMQDWQGEIGRR